MSNEIFANYTTGSTIYAVRFQLDGNVLLTDGATDEVWGTGSRDADDYDITMTEDGVSGHFVGDFDASGNISSGVYRVTVFLQDGGSPADSDFAISQGEIYWSGTMEATPLTLSAQSSRVLNRYPTRSQPDV